MHYETLLVVVFFFSKKKKRPKNPGCQRSVSLDHIIIIHEGPLPPSFCPSLLSRATIIKGCIISTVALSLSLSLSLSRARAKAAAAKSVFWSVDAKETTTTIQQLLKDTHETKTISIIHTQIRSIAVQNRTLLKRSALETEKTQSPCSSSQKKKLEAIGTLIRTFFGTFWTLFALGAVVKVVEVIIIIIFCVFNKES